MLGTVFGKFLHMGFIGGYAILVVLAVRFFLIKIKCERKYVYYLWFVVFLNLCLPISIQGHFSLIPRQMSQLSLEELGGLLSEGNIDDRDVPNRDTDTGSDGANVFHSENGIFPGEENFPSEENFLSGENGKNDGANTESGIYHGADAAYEEGKSALFWYRVESLGGRVWLLGIVVLILWNLCSGVRLKRQLEKGKKYEKENIFLAEGIDTPLLWGVIRPTIYLPLNVTEDEKEYIIAHETYHKKRKDYLAKLAVFCITVLHWFHPLVWVAYVCFCRDMEISCDEAVLAGAKEDIRKRYASSLLTYAARQNGYILTLLTFGEPSLKSRVHNVLQYRKKGIAISVLTALCVGVVVTGLVLRPWVEADPEENVSGQDTEETTRDSNAENEKASVAGEVFHTVLVAETASIEGSGYEEVIANLDENWYYALVEINGAPNKVLLVTDMTYKDGARNREESFSAQVYYAEDGEVYHFGMISGSGTAYPVRYDEEGIYVAGGHYVGKYVLDWQREAGVYFILDQYAKEIFDSEGNVTYTVMDETFEGEKIVGDDSYLNQMIADYSAAEIVQFFPVVK